MNMPQQSEFSCDFNRFLVCKIPKDMVEVDLKIKIKWGKHTLLKDFYTRTEKYRPWERADKHAKMYTKRRSPYQERARDVQESVGNTTSMDSGMYIPTRYRKGCPPKIFTNPNDTSDSDVEFLASHSKPASDWDDNLIDLTQVDDASKQDKNPQPYDRSDDGNTGGIAKAQLQATPKQQPPGWGNWRQKESIPVSNKDKPTP